MGLATISVTKVLAAASAYHVEDVLSESASTGTSWAFLSVARRDAGTGYIVKAQAISETTNVAPYLTLYLFTAAPTSTTNDHALNAGPNHADLAKYIGRIDFPIMEDLGGDSAALGTPGTYSNIPLAFNCTTRDLYGILVTRSAFTQGAGKEMTIKLTVEQY